jgi:hypothetical protein
MDMFAETAIVGYCLSFATKGNKLPVFRFRLQQTKGGFIFAAN